MHAPQHGSPSTSIWRRLAWLVALWCAGVLSLGAAAWLLRQFMRAAGLA